MRQNSKSSLYGGLALLIAALFCIQAGAAVVNTTFDEQTNVKTYNTDIFSTGTLLDEVQVTDSEMDEQRPQMDMNGQGGIAVTYEQVVSFVEQESLLEYSTDGTTFEPVLGTMDFFESGLLWSYPEICYNPSQDMFMWFVTDILTPSPSFIFLKGDLANEDPTMDGSFWTWTGGEGDLENTIHPMGDFFVHLSVSDYSGAGIFQGLALKYNAYDSEAGVAWPSDVLENGCAGSYYDGGSITDTTPSSNIDNCLGNPHMYMVMQVNEGATSKIVYKATYSSKDPTLVTNGGGPGGMDKYSDIEVWPWQGYVEDAEDTANVIVADPEVAASGDNVVVVYMRRDPTFGDWMIRCAYNDGNIPDEPGEPDDVYDWQFSEVTTGGGDEELYPSVSMQGDLVRVAYVSNGNLYLIESEDAGATWGTPEKVNTVDNSVAEEPGCVTIANNGAGMCWVDTRNGNKDIYYTELPAPVVVVESVNGGFGVSASVANIGTAAANDISWSIDIDGTVFVGDHAEGTIDSLAPGESASISPGFVLGLGKAQITISAGGAGQSVEATILGPFVLGL